VQVRLVVRVEVGLALTTLPSHRPETVAAASPPPLTVEGDVATVSGVSTMRLFRDREAGSGHLLLLSGTRLGEDGEGESTVEDEAREA